MLDCDPRKPNTGHLYLRQPHTIQIIQLVEATPPPRPISSVIQSTSVASSSSSSASSYPYTSDSDEDCSSYCSSMVTPDKSSHDRDPVPWTDDTYNTRMKRVHAWRDGFVKATCGTSLSPLPAARPLTRTQTHAHHPSNGRRIHIRQMTTPSVFPLLVPPAGHSSPPHRSRTPQNAHAHAMATAYPGSQDILVPPVTPSSLASRVCANTGGPQTSLKHAMSPSDTFSNNKYPLRFLPLDNHICIVVR
ncbi:hypothetical protein J3R82DRAFT_2209 [Butyriboletus roseoflavus]|nr:hypothetical protein J3R82DRAFT_2209 [Butyriboletus roseoflavus]